MEGSVDGRRVTFSVEKLDKPYPDQVTQVAICSIRLVDPSVSLSSLGQAASSTWQPQKRATFHEHKHMHPQQPARRFPPGCVCSRALGTRIRSLGASDCVYSS